MTVVALTTLVSTVSVVSVVLDRRWQRRKQEASATQPTEEAATDTPATEETAGTLANLTSKVTDSVTAGVRGGAGWLSSFRRKKTVDLPQQFRIWVDKVESIEPPVKEWIHGLSEPGLQAFTEHLSGFCADMGFELAWLVEQQFDQNPELAQTVEKIVLPYCRACQQAAQAQEDLEAHKTLQAFERNPGHRKQQEFGQKLFAKLIQDGLTTASISDYLAASAKQQQQQTLQAIHDAVQKDSVGFNRALKEVIRSLATPVEAAPAPAPAAPEAPAADTPASEPAAASA